MQRIGLRVKGTQRVGSRVKGTQRVGSRAQVMHGNAKMTGGGLRKKDLKYNKQGKIVSKKMSQRAKKEKRLQKAGYITKKGQFGVKKMSGGRKEDYIPLLNSNGNYTKFKELLSGIDSKLNNLTIAPLSYSNNIGPDPNPNTMLFKGVNQEGNEYFIKIGLWYKRCEDSRNILTEREVYKRLKEKYSDNESNYAKMIGATSFEVGAQMYGIIVLEYKDLTGYKNPTESDKDIVEKALKFLEEAGIIHLDIVGNILINEEEGKKDFFLMDFELADISESIPKNDKKLEHKDVYKTSDMADLIIDKIKKDILPPTPEIKRRKFIVSPANTVLTTLNGSPLKKARTVNLNRPNSPSKRFKRRLNMFGSPARTSSTSSPLLLHRTPSPLLLHRTPSPAGTPEKAPATPSPAGTPSTPPPPPASGGNKKRNSRRKKK